MILRRVDKWACVKNCGACCKLGPLDSRPDLGTYLSPEELALYESMIGADDWCVNFDKQSRMCKIYDERPGFCRVEPKKFQKMYDIEEEELNVCHMYVCEGCRSYAPICAMHLCTYDTMTLCTYDTMTLCTCKTMHLCTYDPMQLCSLLVPKLTVSVPTSLYCYTVIPLYRYTVILLYCYTVILSYCYTVILSYCYTVILLYRYTVIL
jgi:Fe-S-cluster containining protein